MTRRKNELNSAVAGKAGGTSLRSLRPCCALLIGMTTLATWQVHAADDQVTRVEYYPNGLVSSTTLPDGSFTSYVYDSAQRLTAIVDADGNTLHYTLDGAGRRIKEEVIGEDGALRRTLSRVYDTFGRINAVQDAAGVSVSFSYDANGNLSSSTDALGRVATNGYDPLGRVAMMIQDVGGIHATTGITYDANHNMREIVDPKGLRTVYQHNAFSELTRLNSPDIGQTDYTYDSAGNTLSSKDARGQSTHFQYDALNRLTAKKYSDSRLDVAYFYDVSPSDCESFESFATGQLVRMTDGSGETRYCRDRFGNLTRKVQTVNGRSFTVRYSYTRAGLISSIAYPRGLKVDYVRDGMGRIAEIGVSQDGSARKVVLGTASHHPFGPVEGWIFGNGRSTRRTLDLNYRPSAIASSFSGQEKAKFSFDWDAAGNLGSLHAKRTDRSTYISFEYDGLNRLTAFEDGLTGTAIERYTYDATGNRTSFTNAEGTQSYQYPADSHRLSAAGGVSRSYDPAGNTVAIGNNRMRFQYNAAGRMSRADRDTVTVMEYTYNGHGEGVCRGSDVAKTYSVFDEVGHWLGDYDGNRDIQQVIWMDDLPVAVIADDTLFYVETDHLGTPRTLVDPQTNAVVWSWDLAGEAFGNSAPDEDPDWDCIPVRFDMRFPGQRFDSATGLNYNYFREYDPGTGRYTQSDPIGLGAGPSTYLYANGMPTGAFDPLGLKAVRAPLPAPGERWKDGTIHCKGGSVVPYVNLARLASYESECIGDCLFAHENSHVKDANRSDPSVCRYWSWLPGIGPQGLVTFDTAEEMKATELSAHMVELQCLYGKLSPGNCTDDTCQKVVRSRINDIVNYFLPMVRNGTYGTD